MLARYAHDLRLYITGFDTRGSGRKPQLAGQRREALTGALQQLVFYLNRGHQRFAHRLDGHELHDVEQLDLGPEYGGQRLCAASYDEAVFRQIDYDQEMT